MPIRVKCGNCKKTLSVKDHLAGKKIKCPVCQSVVAVSASPPAKPPAPTAEPSPNPTTPTKKTAPTTKPAVATKPPPDKSKTNGTPSADHAKSNGTPTSPKEPEPIELPPENVEAEAASAFADEPKPPVEDEAPKTIDVKCQWCDEDVKFPLELAGKQTQCPNMECRRIIKVPMPKVVGKKDWRKMDRQGPAAARVNMPEALDDAWGTEEATRARKTSLEQAGAIDVPPPKQRDVFERVTLGIKVIGVVVLLGFAVAGIWGLRSSNQQQSALNDAEKLISSKPPKVKDPPLAAEVHRTLGLLYLRSKVKNPRERAKEQFLGAASRVGFELSDTNNAINEQLFLIDLTLSQLEMAGEGDEVLANINRKFTWKEVLPELQNTLSRIETPEVQVIALREIGTRLAKMKQEEMAIGLAGSLGGEGGKKTIAYRQQIALTYAMNDSEENRKKSNLPDIPVAGKKDDPPPADARVGYAEGFARKGKDKYEDAVQLANLPGPLRDRLDAYLGIAAIAWQDRHKDEAARFIKEAVTISQEKNSKDHPSDWQLLQLAKLAGCTEDAETVKQLVERLPGPFKMRARLEVFRVTCEKSTGTLDPDKLERLAEIESADDKEGITLALAWMSLAQHNARNGASLARNRNDFETRVGLLNLSPEMIDQIRGMVDIGTYLGSMK